MKKRKNSKSIFAFIVFLLIIGGYFYFKSDKTAPAAVINQGSGFKVIADPNPPKTKADEIKKTMPIMPVTVISRDNSFNPKEIRVKLGDRIRINLDNQQGYHNWVVDEFSAATGKATEGNSSSVEFTASKIGAFEYYSSVGSNRQQGMTGKLIVE